MVTISFCPACGCCSAPKSRGPVTGVKGAATSSLGYQDMPSWPAARAQTKSNTNSPWEWSFSQAGAPAAGWPSASFSISASGCQPAAGPVQPASAALARKRQSTNGPGVAHRPSQTGCSRLENGLLCTFTGLGRQIVQPVFRVKGGHAAKARRGDRLAVNMVGHIAGGKHAGNAGGGCHAVLAAAQANVTVLHVELAGKYFGVGVVAYGDEHAVHVELGQGVVVNIPDAHAGYAIVVAQHFIKNVVPANFHLAFGLFFKQPILQNLFGAQLVATMDQGDLAGNIGQIQRFFHRRVAAAHHGHRLVAVEKAVARSEEHTSELQSRGHLV